jgi:hypothetical protein
VIILGFILLVLGGPRLFNVLWWLVQPVRYNLAFQSSIIGILGIVFLPWTTLMYVSVYAGGITGFDWVWLAIGFFADLASYGSSGYGGKKQMSAPKSTTPPPATPAQ